MPTFANQEKLDVYNVLYTPRCDGAFNATKYLLCGSTNHTSSDKICPVRKQRQDIHKVLVTENITYKEFKSKYGNENRFSLLEDYDTNFPKGAMRGGSSDTTRE